MVKKRPQLWRHSLKLREYSRKKVLPKNKSRRFIFPTRSFRKIQTLPQRNSLVHFLRRRRLNLIRAPMRQRYRSSSMTKEPRCSLRLPKTMSVKWSRFISTVQQSQLRLCVKLFSTAVPRFQAALMLQRHVSSSDDSILAHFQCRLICSLLRLSVQHLVQKRSTQE